MNTNEALPMTHDNLNTAADPIDLDTHNYAGWVDRLKALKLPKRFIILDGFLLYWDRECVENYDLKFFVRESYEVLKERRRIRQTYHTAGQTFIPISLFFYLHPHLIISFLLSIRWDDMERSRRVLGPNHLAGLSTSP
jgi:hypothetical protein